MKELESISAEQDLVAIQKMIVDCTNHTSHQVQGALARIKGLSHLYQIENTCQQKDYLVNLISDNAEDLSKAIREFNVMLNNCLCKEKISNYRTVK